MFAKRKTFVSGAKRGTSKRRAPSGMRRAASRGRTARVSRSVAFPKVYHFRRNTEFDIIYMQPQGGSAPSFAAGYQFQISQLPAYQEFTNLFDMYRLNMVVMRFIPTGTQVQVNATDNNSEVPLIYCAIDYNNASVPASATEIKEYGNCKVWAINRPWTLIFRPRTATPVYRDNVNAAYLQNPARLWLDCNYPDIPHYGVRLFVPGGTTQHVYRVRLELTYYMSFKNTK